MSNAVGIVGLGLMGSVLARRLIAASFDVVGYDIDTAKTEALVARGGRAAASIADVARTEIRSSSRCSTPIRWRRWWRARSSKRSATARAEP
jgi:6-phosphogluconate dehydrogenase (decarboxylating)